MRIKLMALAWDLPLGQKLKPNFPLSSHGCLCAEFLLRDGLRQIQRSLGLRNGNFFARTLVGLQVQRIDIGKGGAAFQVQAVVSDGGLDLFGPENNPLGLVPDGVFAKIKHAVVAVRLGVFRLLAVLRFEQLVDLQVHRHRARVGQGVFAGLDRGFDPVIGDVPGPIKPDGGDRFEDLGGQ
jgi:hypothetical protein